MSGRGLIQSALDEIRMSDAIIVLGAGVSFAAGMPLAGQLIPLIWHTLDVHPNVLRKVCDAIGVVPCSAKRVVGDDWKRSCVAFAEIAVNRDARLTFQHCFANLNREREVTPSPAHVALARLLHSNHVLQIVSLNWDTLLESAFTRRYGIDINSQGVRLWKPHGDCARPDDEWILPHEPGGVPEEVVNHLNELVAERPRVLLIVGYSERDDVIIKRLIQPLENRWRVFRIGPDAVGEGAIRLSAQEALWQLAEKLSPAPDIPGWDFVTFANQRGIEAAISGERLGPRDVDACPRLPHYDSARRALELLHIADIAGLAGCGKSITAWQLAREYNRHGWEVIRPDPGDSQEVEASIQVVGLSKWKRVLVVDDTQIFPSRFIERLSELAGPSLKLILATTDAKGERSRSIQIPAKIAVEILSTDFRRRRDEVLPIVRRFDSHVGDEYSATPLERRIVDAAKSDTPWQFAFVLRGGWRQAREHLQALRDFDRADLLLALIAARHLLSLDLGCSEETIVSDAMIIGRSEKWVRSGIALLHQRGSILPSGMLRCLHGQAAAVVIQASLKDRREDTFPLIVAVLRSLVANAALPSRGVRWLLEEVLGADAYLHRSLEQEGFFPPQLLDKLLSKLLCSSEAVARREASFLLSRLLWYQELLKDRLLAEASTLALWIESATGVNAYAIGDLLNSIHYPNEVAAQQLVESINPEIVWACIVAGLPSDGYAWGHYLGRLAAAGGDEWRARMKTGMPKELLSRLISHFKPSDIEDLAGFVEGVGCFDFDFGLFCLQQTASVFQQAFADDAFKAYSAVRRLQFGLLGHGLFGEKNPTRIQRNISRLMTEGIHAKRIATGIVACRFGDWETYAWILDWVHKVNPKKHREIVAALDWDMLDARSLEFWTSPCREFRLLLSCLRIDKDGQPVRKWVAEHVDRIDEIDPILSGVSPEAAIAVFRKGGRVNLSGHNGSDWGLQAYAVARIAEIEANVAIEILAANGDHIVAHLSKLEEIDAEEFPIFLKLVSDLAPSLLTKFCSAINLQLAAEKWPRATYVDRKEVRRGGRQVLKIISENSNGEIRRLAERLLARSSKKQVSSE